MASLTTESNMKFRPEIGLRAWIELLHRAEILPPGNMGFSICLGSYLLFPDENGGEQAIPFSASQGADLEGRPLWQWLHSFLYQRRSDLKVIISSRLPYTLTAAHAGREIPPLLDDFAQLVGVTTRVVEGKLADPRFHLRVLKGLQRRNAVLIPEWGGLCAAATFGDALAVVQVLEKGCRAHIESAFLGGGFRINPVEAWLMRVVYKYKYSKMNA